ncbi:MAG TPA: hypothetical protein VJB99_01355 [Patescibacteria group bacterium]|nr:hypothetical protein [Patescibacteria group bacterium]
MTPLEWINTGIVAIGLPTLCIALLDIGRKLQLLDSIKEEFDAEIKPTLQDLVVRFGIVEDRVETLWQDKFAPTNSPRQLNDLGKRILEESGIQGVIENKKNEFFETIKGQNLTNAYDAEQAILAAVSELPNRHPEILDSLKEGAFKTGQTVDAVLFIGGIHLRNLIFKELGFSLEDLDEG